MNCAICNALATHACKPRLNAVWVYLCDDCVDAHKAECDIANIVELPVTREMVEAR